MHYLNLISLLSKNQNMIISVVAHEY